MPRPKSPASSSTTGSTKVGRPTLPNKAMTNKRTPASIADCTPRATALPKIAVSGGKKTFRRRSPTELSHPIEPLIIPAKNSQTTNPVNKKTAKFWEPFPAGGGDARKKTEKTRLYTRIVDSGLSIDQVQPNRLRLYLALSSLRAKFLTRGVYREAEAMMFVRVTGLMPFWGATKFRGRCTSEQSLRAPKKGLLLVSNPVRAAGWS
jgi:hypothetical protein